MLEEQFYPDAIQNTFPLEYQRSVLTTFKSNNSQYLGNNQIPVLFGKRKMIKNKKVKIDLIAYASVYENESFHPTCHMHSHLSKTKSPTIYMPESSSC